MKLMVVTLSIFMIILSFPAGLETSNGIILAVSSAEGQAGDQVAVSVSAENAASSEGGQFLLLFDPDIIQPVTMETGEMITNANNSLHMYNLEYQPGELIFMWVTPEADTVDSGIICEVTFNLIKDGTTVLNLDEIVLVPDGVRLGSIEPGNVVIGDTGEAGRDNDALSDNDDTLTGDSKADEDEVVDEQAAESDDIADEESALSTGAARTNTILYILIIVAFALVLGLFVLFKKTKKKGNSKAGR